MTTTVAPANAAVPRARARDRLRENPEETR